MLELSNVLLPLDAGLPQNEKMLVAVVARVLSVEKQKIFNVKILKRSVDARKKRNVHFVATLGVVLSSESDEQKTLAAGVKPPMNLKRHVAYMPLSIPRLSGETKRRPVVVGMGPAGLFAALYLAKAGMRPIVIERGQAVEQRTKDVEAFSKGAGLNPESNIQFGEGGAGTFSDGKLTTNTKNPYTAHVLHWFIEAGAPEEILWQAKPHIGTDHLVKVVRSMREHIIALGGEVRFGTQLTNLHFKEGSLCSVTLQNTMSGFETLDVHQLILATGHSARDTFEMLYEAKLHLEQKPFSVGVRIEHEQSMINQAQYGIFAQHPALGAADYKLAVHLDSGRSVYTFCMCPGGEVVCAASEPETVVVNGMSCFARDGRNANSAILVNVGPGDFEDDHPLAGIEFQRSIESSAYQEAILSGGKPYQAPAQKLGDFLRQSEAGGRNVQPSYERGVVSCDLHACLPKFVTESLEEALPLFDRKLKGFADPHAILTGVETRSSSPVRIRRNERYQAEITESVDSGVYPCGEGAGYAGGIMSAAVDGLRIAESLAQY